MKPRNLWITVGLASWLMAASAPSMATAVWTSGSGSCNANGTLYYSSCNTTSNGGSGSTSLLISAISDTGGAIAGGNALQAAYVGYYNTNHFGVSSNTVNGGELTATAPQHAMDNDGNSEFLLYSFGSAVKLSQLTLGWSQNDSDITVLAYQGSGAPALTGGTTSYGGSTGLTNKGWTVIGNYFNVCGSNGALGCSNGGPATASVNINASNVSSSYWLIGAYNSLGGTALDSNFDYVKVLSVAGAATGGSGAGVPEPSSLVLAAIALFGLTTLRRRRAV